MNSKISKYLNDKIIWYILAEKVGLTIGKFFGCLSRLWPPSYRNFNNMIADGYYTARWKNRFRFFGKGSRIRNNCEILNPEDISIGNNVLINPYCMIESWRKNEFKHGSITIGNNCNLGEYTHITTTNNIVIGDNLLTGRFVLITDNSHGLNDGSDADIAPNLRAVISKGPIVIGDNVWLADKVVVLPGVSIGNGAIIAANAVVTHSIPDYAVAAGVPAKVIKILK